MMTRFTNHITGKIRPYSGYTAIVFGMLVLVVGGFTYRQNRPGTNKAPLRPGQSARTELDKYWQNAKQEVYKSYPELMCQHQAELDQGIRYQKLFHGDLKEREVAITFDDGPHPKYTPKLLSILKQYDAKATFFLVGEMAARYPKLVKAEYNAGHNIGNHTYHHVNLTKIPDEEIAVEIKACGEVLKKIVGRAPHLFRPPGGDYDSQVAEVAQVLGYTMVLWTDDPGDYAKPGAKIIEERLMDRINNGGIILIHDGIQQTVDVLPQILQYLKARNYKLVTIDEMIKQTPQQGVIK